MSYRVDIPTLSANEVYTLTFEYEGTETIQLIVGDLTLETTDRRVVFTTTSPVNHIESNVNLTNLNIYEGYYESDDFGGEYTQESYIEGKSLINLMPASSPKTLSQGWSLDFDETTGVATIVFNNNTNNFSCSMRSFGMMKKLKPATYYTYFVEILENSLVDGSGNKPNIMFYNASGYMYPSTQCPYNVETVKGDYIGKSGTERWTIKNEASPGKYVWTIKTVDTFVDTMVDADKIFQTAALNGTIKVRMMIIEGDYVDNPIETNWFPQGIGCVKSPKILSQTKEPNLAETELFQMSTSSSTGSSYDKETQTISITNIARATSVAFYFQPQKWGYGDYENFCVEFDVIYIEKLKDGEPPYFSLAQHATPRGDTKANTPLYEGKHYTLYFGSSALLDTKSTLLRLAVNGGTGGINKTVTITNFKLYHVNNINGDNGASEVGTYDCCEVTTPDDLELYSFTDTWDNITIVDTLDLTTGIVTKNVGVLDITDINTLVYSGYDSTNDLYNVSCSFANFPNIVAKGNDTQVSSNILERKWYTVEGLFSHGVNGKFEFRISGTRGITSGDEAKQWVIDNLIIFYERTPEIIQLDINVLKSYYNGSITTSSQQLAPTLKTTLPISNKFTTTNLTSGSTYNVYFDGTATKLDAGGTIITDPVSPCEVECGGTTLTIEGTDIQNVRVLETTNKNEVGSVCGTTDVELSGVKCVQGGIPNLLSTLSTDWENGTDYSVCIRYKYGIDVQPNEKYVFTVSNTRGLTYKEIAIWNTDKWVSNAESIITTQRLTANTPYILTVPSGVTKVYIYFPYDSSGNLNQAHEYELRMQKGTVDLGYGGQKEATIPLVCNLEQPIKLRSLGTTYDSYNPVTGELTKRIGVSETDGSYSVLSRPIVSKTTTDKFFDDFGNEWLSHNSPITNIGYYVNENSGELMVSELSFYTDYLPIPKQTRYIKIVGENRYKRAVFYNASKQFVKGFSSTLKTNYDWNFDTTQIPTNAVYVRFSGSLSTDSNTNYTPEPVIFIVDDKGNVIKMAKPDAVTIPHLYTNGQVKVYSDSEVYPTTILNGQSTNNYEVNELNRYNNYTIRYDGTCESINLANKSNEQGTNRIVKSGTDGRGNLTFVNNSEDIDNVLLVEHDVREQKINHFNGLQTVEISQLFVSSKQNLFEAYMKNDFEYTTDLRWGTQQYGSLHNGVFKCGELVGGENLQMTWNLIRPHVDAAHSSKLKEDNPIVLANKVYNISFNISIVDHHTVNGNHNYNIRAFDFNGNEVLPQKATGGRVWLDISSNGVTNPTPTNFINLDVIFSKDIYCFALHADYGGAWKFDCTITDFTICEPENAKPDIPLVYEYIDLPQPVQLNRIHKENMPYSDWSNVLGHHVNLADGIAYDSYNPITGEYTQRVYKMTLNGDDGIRYVDNWSGTQYVIDDSTLPYPRKAPYRDTVGRYAGLIDVDGVPYGASYNVQNDIFVTWINRNGIALNLPRQYTNNIFKQDACKQWLRENPITLYYELETPIVTQLTPINIPTFEGGILQLITTDGKVFPMVEYSMPTNNRYDTSSWEAGAVYTQRNMTEAYFNESTTPMIPTETTTLTTDHISSGSIILNDNGNGLIVLKGNYTGRDIPYFTGMRSVEAIEVETTPSPDQPLFGKGGRK